MTFTALSTSPSGQAPARRASLPAHIWIGVAAATSTVIGVIWDISWHRSIGRDTLWTPAHLAIYLGGLLAGGAYGWLALKTTFRGTPEERRAAVSFWGFRAPLGAWLCIWGAIAMLASAPLDNWWHNAYGLDVKVLSPPHTLLALGMWSIQAGALLLVLAQQNRATSRRTERLCAVLAAYVAGILLQNAGILGIEQIGFANDAHSAIYYQFAGLVFPVVLVAAGRCARLFWPATAAAAAYMGISLVMIWALQLFPATPKLAPVFNRVTHMIPAPFPLLLVFPAIAVDLLMRRMGRGRDWRLAVATGAAFLAVLLLVQWFFAGFLLSPHARNFLFGVDQWDYSSRVGAWRYEYWRSETNPVTPRALAFAALLSVVSARLGLWWGSWMTKVKR